MISFEEFKKLDIKIGKILEAEKIEGSEKLIKLQIDVGEETPRQIVAGVGLAYPNTEELVGREIVVICNLEPKVMLGHTSYGMLLAADNEGIPVLLHPEKSVPPGSIVR